MSTHLHLVVTDENGVLPSFLQFFHRIVALGAKVLRAWEGPVWDHEPTSVVRLTTREAVVEKIAYTLANPVAAGLVRHAHEWPGAKVLVDELGSGVLRAPRPDVYLDPTNPAWPEEATLGGVRFRRGSGRETPRISVARSPPSLRGRKHFGRTRSWRERARSAPHRACSVSPYERATSFEPLRALNPTFAVGRESKDAWRSAAAAVRAFRTAYRAALAHWRQGVRNVLFPEGTWWMRVFHAVGIRSGLARGVEELF